MLLISDTNLHSGLKVRMIEVIEDAQFKVLHIPIEKREGSKKLFSDNVTECIMFPAGARIIGEITAIQLHKGVIICY